ncbi:MAG: ACP S-malonyltransferase [Planctomycetota bacterium]
MSAPETNDSGAAQGAILFPGQGSQALGMGLDLVAENPSAAAWFDLAVDSIGLDLRAILAGDDRAELDRTDVCQPAILATSMAALSAFESRDLLDASRVSAVAGLSLGEYTALTWAGALQGADALKLVRLRGEAMQAASNERPSGMLSLVGATPESAAALCEAAREDGILVVANLLAPGQVAIAGTQDALERASGQLKEHGIRKAVPLSVAGAFHSPCMESAAAALADALDATTIETPRVPVVMNVTAEATTDPDTIRANLKRQVTAPVLWQASIEALFDAGCSSFFEPAPGKQLTNMLKRYDREWTAATCGTLDDLQSADAWPGGGS